MRRVAVPVAVLLAAAFALVGCTLTSGASSSLPSSAGPSSTLSSVSPTASIDGMVDVGPGRQIRVSCSGLDESGPTVVLVSDARSAGDEWMAVRRAGGSPSSAGPARVSPTGVFGQVATFARVCAYDRPGTLTLAGAVSPSSRVRQPTTAADGVADLHAWLAAAAVASPVVLVGHGWGGMIATLYAATYPSAVAGLVLVDPATSFLKDALTPAQWSSFLAVGPALVDGSNSEAPDYANSVESVRVARVGQIPVMVLTASKPFDFGSGVDAFPAWLSAASTFASRLGATHVTDTGSAHDIPIDNPDVVVSSVRQVLDQVG